MKLENPLNIKPFRKRRAKLARNVGTGIVVLPTAPERTRNADNHYDYRWDSGFYYLTGFPEPREFDFLVNMKTARALGITLPPEILLQVTEVIE